MEWVQSCQPLHFGRSLLRPRALGYVAMLTIISLCSPSEKQFIFIFDPMRSCGHQICQQPVVRVPFCVWDVGCATANRRSRFNQLTNRSVRFNSRFYASLPGETTSIFNHFKSPWRSEKLKASSQVMNLAKKTHTKISGKSIIQNSFSVCTINAERQACEVQRLLLQFLGLFCRPWRNVRRRTTRQLEAPHQQRKGDRKYAEDFPLIFMGCDVIWAEMLFTNFFVVHNITLSAADHDICSGAHFRKSKLRRRTMYVRYTQNLITTLKIWFCYAKVERRVGSSVSGRFVSVGSRLPFQR